MRISIRDGAVSIGASLSLLAGCSGGAAIAPKPSAPHVQSGPLTLFKTHVHSTKNFVSYNNCPPTGRLVYFSDDQLNTITIYAGQNLMAQAPCGQLGRDVGIFQPGGMFVKSSNHRLLVANAAADNVLMFARGGTKPIKTFVDPTGERPADVTMAADGTVIASNGEGTTRGVAGSISTWHQDGTFVGNFPMIDDLFGMYLTVQANGNLYFNDIDIETGGALWKGSCPLGACGAFVRQSPTTAFPGGLRSRSGDSELVEIDSGDASGTFRRSYSLPSYDQVKCRMLEFPRGFDMDAAQKTIWYADEAHNKFVEMTYGCIIIGAVNGEVNGDPSGAAVDSPEPL